MPRSASMASTRRATPSARPMARPTLDASLLLLAQVGFIEAEGSALHRHGRGDRDASCWSTASSSATTPTKPTTACAPGEGAFLACSFWLADAYVSIGRQDDADKMFEAAAVDPQRSRPAGRGVRHGERPPDRQLPAGLLACRPDQHRLQPDARRTAPPSSAPRSTARRADAGRPKSRSVPASGHEKMAEPGGHHVRRRAPSSTAR